MSKKRKHGQIEDQDDTGFTTAQAGKSTLVPDSATSTKSKGQLRQEKSERRAKKLKKVKEQQDEDEETSTIPAIPIPSSTAPTSKSKTQRAKIEDKKRSKREEADIENDEVVEETLNSELNTKAHKKDKKKAKRQEEASNDKKLTPARFIVFVGNLPYDATVEQIKEHFSKISPSSVRQTSDKATGKGKGFAFLEFDHYDKMKTCLKLYHHSIFDAEARNRGDETQGEEGKTHAGSKKSTGRRINVELTAGGGGKSKGRKAKINSKNQKLEEERERRRAKDIAEREKSGPKQKAIVETGANATEVTDRRGDVHPSRLSRVSH